MRKIQVPAIINIVLKQIFYCKLFLSKLLNNMTRIVLIGALFFTISCNNSKKNDQTDSGTIQPGIENVNGNIPDTSNTITLDTSDSTSKKDPLPK